LAAFLAGSISHPTVHVLGLSSEWYGQVPFLILSGGFVYLIIVGEWERVLYKKRNTLKLGRELYGSEQPSS